MSTLLAPAPTPTGLTLEQLRSISEDDLAILAGWHATKAGDDEGRPWWPWAIRVMPLETRLQLATDALADAVWERRERALVVEDPVYFVDGYGHLQAPQGPPEPFRMWPEQAQVMEALVERLRVIVLKARQLGLTWIAVHYAAWLLAFARHTPNARVLAMSKTEDDATKLLGRVRRVLELLPPYLRPQESPQTGKPNPALSKLDLVGRGSMQSLVSTPAAARMETVTFLLWDEVAFSRHGQARAIWTAALPTLGSTGQAALISTGNGPEDAPGDGQAFAQLFNRAYAGQDDDSGVEGAMPLHAIFLPDSVHPDRTPEWRDQQRLQFAQDEDFRQEHPETVDEALTGPTGLKVYSLAGIAAAARLGAKYDAMLEAGTIPRPDGDLLRPAADYGELTHVLVLWPLEGGGIYVAPGEIAGGGAHGMTHRQLGVQLCRNLNDVQWIDTDGERWPLAGGLLYDAAQPASNRTVREVIDANVPLYPPDEFPGHPEADLRSLDVWQPVRLPSGAHVRARGVPFGKYKVALRDYLRLLLKRTLAGEQVGILAISPRCPVLLRQLRGLEKINKQTDTIRKGDDDAHDALLAGLLPSWALYHGIVITEDDEELTTA